MELCNKDIRIKRRGMRAGLGVTDLVKGGLSQAPWYLQDV